jgi:AcrR family transcriptional regulator
MVDDGSSTRVRLLQAASAAIADEGWLAASVRSVTGRADVPLGAITYHFGGKEELFREAAIDTLRQMFETPNQILATATTLPELVDRLLGWSTADDARAEQRMLLLETMTQSRRDPALERAVGYALDSYRASVGDAIARLAGGGSAHSNGVAAAFAAHCDGLWLHTIIDPEFPRVEAAEDAAVMWKRALAPGGSGE